MAKKGSGQSLPHIRRDPQQTLQDIEESPIIIDGSKLKRNLKNLKTGGGAAANLNGNANFSSQNFQQSLTIAKDVF